MVVAALCFVSKDRKPLELMERLMKPNIWRKEAAKKWDGSSLCSRAGLMSGFENVSS